MQIKTLRKARGWSQEQVAMMAGISTRTLQRAERGGRASPETLKALAAVLDVDFTDLMDKDQTMTQQHQISDRELDAIEYVQDLKGFYSHLAAFAVVVLFLTGVNLLVTPGYFWVAWVVFGWGIGLAIHGLQVFDVFTLLGPDWEKRQIEKRLKRMR